MKKYFIIIIFILIHSKSSSIENKKSPRKNVESLFLLIKSKPIACLSLVSVLGIICIILIKNYLNKQNQEKKEKEINELKLREDQNESTQIEIIDAEESNKSKLREDQDEEKKENQENKKKDVPSIEIKIIDNKEEYKSILPSLQLIYNPYKFFIQYTQRAEYVIKEGEKELNKLISKKEHEENLDNLLKLLLSLQAGENFFDFLKCSFCRINACKLNCKESLEDNRSEVDLYREGHYK